MGLKALPPLLSTLPNIIGWLPPKSEAEVDRDRAERNAGRSWYKTAAWRRLRWQVLTEATFTCIRCGDAWSHDTSHLVADHVVPHKGDTGLFWDRANLQCLCKRCHDTDKQSEERRAGR